MVGLEVADGDGAAVLGEELAEVPVHPVRVLREVGAAVAQVRLDDQLKSAADPFASHGHGGHGDADDDALPILEVSDAHPGAQR